MNNIACIVVTYNRLELLKQCINALLHQSFNNFDIIVVNNGSTDGTEKWLKENKYTTPILKWKTREWGEIPADFGRK